MTALVTFAWLLIAALLLWAAFYWAFVITEGVYFGRRIVVWLYDLTADSYDANKRYTLDEERVLVVEPILGELRGVPQPLLLDVAVGTGRVPYFLLADGRFDGRIIALDPSEKMMQLGVQNLRRFPGRVDWVRQTAAPLPFANNSFDAVTSLESIEFFPDPAAALQEMVRVLRPGAPLLVTRRREWEAYGFWPGGRYYSQERYTALLESLGLSDVMILTWQNNYDLVIGVKTG